MNMKKSLLAISLTAAVIFANVASTFAINPQPEPPGDCQLIRYINPGVLVGLDPQPEPPVEKPVLFKSIAVR
jgi:hypothetical protein